MLGVDAEALRDIGSEVSAAAATLRNVPNEGLAPGQLSAAATAARAAEQAWLADLRRLTGDVARFGTGLTEAARDYRATDHANADDLRAPR